MTAVDWQPLARQLADQLAEEDVLHSPAWRAALEQTPRHLFVPAFHTQQPDGTWITTAEGDDGWLEAVYQNTPLVTALATTTDGHQVTVSSSTKPGLMIRMLERLEIRDEHRVLEIGTGTGYNAGLLCHRLGATQVFSVDIGTDLVTTARERLATLSHTPTLAATDGTDGLPQHGPYDRIIATCSVPAIPWAWAEQLRPGGLLLVDLKPAIHAGNLVLLKRYADRLEGRFLPTWAGFMTIRSTDTAPPTLQPAGDPPHGTRSKTGLDPLPWNSLVPWLLAQAELPAGTTFGYRGMSDTGPEWATFTAPDSSWCCIRMRADVEGQREVRQAGPAQIWSRVEAATASWTRLGKPSWDRLGLTVHQNGSHRVWLDHSDSDVHWDMRS
ncbi:methyltransferase domain-containing protein [Amycolatopsis sp. NPDC004378]